MGLTNEQYEQAIVSILPADGSGMIYADLVATMQREGIGEAVGMLRGMKQRGLLISKVELVADGTISHTYARPVQG